MVKRRFWLEKIESAWQHRNVVWLSGVRRVGKTFLCRSIPDVEYFDCELPRVRRMMDDPQSFLKDVKGRRVVVDVTFVINIVRHFSSHRPTEIISAPKIYGFDTGFVCYHKGWFELRSEDLGILWEHYVLNELHAHFQSRDIHYWRDKRGHEIDFVLTKRGQPPTAVECKWSVKELDHSNLQAFWRQYPQTELIVVAQDIERPFAKTTHGMSYKYLNLPGLIEHLEKKHRRTSIG